MDFNQIFKAYDVRGTYPDQIDEKKFKRIAQAYAAFVRPKIVAVGRDVRTSGPQLQKAVINGLVEAGVKVVDIGVVPTEMLYFAVGYYHYDGGIQVSASHNPAQFNGLKMIKGGVEAISSDSGLLDIKKIAESDDRLADVIPGEVVTKDITEDYLDYLTRFCQFDGGRPLKVVANSNFGPSGQLMTQLLKRLANTHISLTQLNFELDGSFPKGNPSPQLVENRQEVSDLIKKSQADFGVSWDPDGDRCFIADEKGEFIQGCHLTALLSQHFLKDHPGSAIMFDITNILAVTETVTAAGGRPIPSRVGHAFIKKNMIEVDAIFGGENSGHSYFKDFYYADNGLIPFILFLNIVSQSDKKVSELVETLRANYPVSGEMNFEVADKAAALSAVEEKYVEGEHDTSDGISVNFGSWRFNVRPSNTENLLRLNVEAREPRVCQEKTEELKSLITSLADKA